MRQAEIDDGAREGLSNQWEWLKELLMRRTAPDGQENRSLPPFDAALCCKAITGEIFSKPGDPADPPGRGTQFGHDRFTELVGLVWDDVSADRVTAHLDVKGRHHQPMGIVHGGVYTTIIQVMASVGAYLNRSPRGGVPVGVNNTTDFMRPHRSGRLNAEAKPLSRDPNDQLWDVEIRRAEDDKLVAKGQVRLAALSLDRLQ